MDIAVWIGAVAIICLATIAPALPWVRRGLGLVEDTPEARVVRRALRLRRRSSPPAAGFPPPKLGFPPDGPDEVHPASGSGGGMHRRVPVASGGYPPQPPPFVEVEALPETEPQQLSRALQTLERLSDEWAIANVLNLLAFLEERQAAFARALELHAEALRIFERLDDVRGEADTLNNIAIVHARAGNVEQAVELHRQTLQRREAADPQREGVSCNNLAIALAARGKRAEAEQLFARALHLAQREADYRGGGKAISNATALRVVSGTIRVPEALLAFDASIELRKIGADKRGLAKTTNNRGVTFMLAGQPAEAGRAFDEAAAQAYDIGDRLSYLRILENRCMAARASEEPMQSIEARFHRGLQEAGEAAQLRTQDAEAIAPEDVAATDEWLKSGTPVALLSSGSTTPETSIDRLLARAALYGA